MSLLLCLFVQPLEFDEFHTLLKESGLACGAAVVSEFLDHKVTHSKTTVGLLLKEYIDLFKEASI